MIRWSYIVPRLVVVGILWAFFVFAFRVSHEEPPMRLITGTTPSSDVNFLIRLSWSTGTNS